MTQDNPAIPKLTPEQRAYMERVERENQQRFNSALEYDEGRREIETKRPTPADRLMAAIILTAIAGTILAAIYGLLCLL